MITLLFLFSLSADAANFTNFQSNFNSFQPQSPNPPANRFKEAPQNNFRSSGEINPYVDGNNWSTRSNIIDLTQNKSSSSNNWFPNLINQQPPTINNSEWFPNLTDNIMQPYNNHNNRNNADFNEKIALINPKNYDMTPSSLNRDTKLLSLAYEIISTVTCSSTRPLNILHLGTGSGFVPVALALFSRPIDTILSLDDSNKMAKDNIIRDGKEVFLNRLSVNQVIDLANAQIPPASNNLPYDIIVSSKSVNSSIGIPRSLKDSLVPRGIIIYPEIGIENRRIKIDKIDEYGNLQTIKYI